jgi:hypothetical protein
MVRWKSIWIAAVIGLSCWVPLSRADDAGQKAVAETRQALRKEGFKTDLADFDLSTTPELRAREAILMEAVGDPTPTMRNGGMLGPREIIPLDVNPPDLMEAVKSNSAAIVWTLATPLRPELGARSLYSWDDFRKAIDAKGLPLDRASAAILAGPIRFELTRRAGRYRISPPLSQINGLIRLLENRIVLALHDNNLPAAWTNLLAATRLVTAWEPEPPTQHHVARFETMKPVFEATWQALQTNMWSDAQLARLQAEWESVDYFTRLTDTAAFQRAYSASAIERKRLGPKSDVPFGEFMAWALRFPVIVWGFLNSDWQHDQYLQHASYIDEATEMLHYRDAELALRRAVQVPTWSDMRPFLSESLRPPFNSYNKDLLSYAAVAEVQRRILITALALERYRARHGTYPHSLSGLVPEFLRKPPIDFMDGHPLRYRLGENGHFILYSVGLDCVDHGGQIPSRNQQSLASFEPSFFVVLPKGDIVWPLPAAIADVEGSRAETAKAQAERRGRDRSPR